MATWEKCFYIDEPNYFYALRVHDLKIDLYISEHKGSLWHANVCLGDNGEILWRSPNYFNNPEESQAEAIAYVKQLLQNSLNQL